MKKIIILLLIICCIILTGCIKDEKNKDDNKDTEKIRKIIVSTTSGVAPLIVHFSADLFENDISKKEFHNYDYTWDFGDVTSGNWGTDGKSKNSAKAGITAHVYEKPGTYNVRLTIKNKTEIINSYITTITVTDPDIVYAGTATICISDSAHNDFKDAPVGAGMIVTDDLSTITQYAVSGRRILFHRGSSWTTMGLTWPENSVNVTIGAYGTGINPDASGLFENAPVINVTKESFLPLDYKQDLRIMDLHLIDHTRINGSFGGGTEMQRIMFLRLKIEGFSVGLGWTNWNDPTGMQIDQMAIISCDISDSDINIVFAGSERIMIIGNNFRNARTSHVLRVWKSYKGVISHNLLSGSSLDSTTGRHALKLHGPSEKLIATSEWGHENTRTEFTIISDNIFGSSGPWPVSIGPQDSWSDERLSNIIFERNKYFAKFGRVSTQSVPLDTGIRACVSKMTIRNNIIDGSGYGKYFNGIVLAKSLVAPPPSDIWIYNNTIYKLGAAEFDEWIGVSVESGINGVWIKNNLVSFPGIVNKDLIKASGAEYVESNNLMTDTPGFINVNNTNPLINNYGITSGSPAIDKGIDVQINEDIDGAVRPKGLGVDIGAFEYDGN